MQFAWVRKFTSKGGKQVPQSYSRFEAVDLGQKWGKVSNNPGHVGLSISQVNRRLLYLACLITRKQVQCLWASTGF